jgi:hypothetical protein
MTTSTPSRVRALPHVSGETRRVKSEPAKLSALSARVMSASGAFSTKRGAAGARVGAGPILWAALFFVAAGTFAVARDQGPASDASRLEAMIVDGAEHVAALGVEAYVPPKDVVEAPAAVDHDRQDQYEIARFLRHAAPASGPAPRAQTRPGVQRLASR